MRENRTRTCNRPLPTLSPPPSLFPSATYLPPPPLHSHNSPSLTPTHLILHLSRPLYPAPSSFPSTRQSGSLLFDSPQLSQAAFLIPPNEMFDERYEDFDDSRSNISLLFHFHISFIYFKYLVSRFFFLRCHGLLSCCIWYYGTVGSLRGCFALRCTHNPRALLPIILGPWDCMACRILLFCIIFVTTGLPL